MDANWTYRFPAPIADYRTDPAFVATFRSTDLIGVDGRETGKLARFPGFQVVDRLPNVTSSGSSPFDETQFSSEFQKSGIVDYLKYVAIQKEDSAYQLEGFVYRTGYNVYFRYYDTETGTWGTYQIDDESAGHMDVTFGGRYLWYVCERLYGYTVYMKDGFWHRAQFGHVGMPAPLLGLQIIETSTAPYGKVDLTGFTDAIVYVGVRFKDSRRMNLVSPLRVQRAIKVAPSADWGFVVGYIPIRPYELDHYDTIEVYRSVNNGTSWYLEISQCIPISKGLRDGTLSHLWTEGYHEYPPVQSVDQDQEPYALIGFCLGAPDEITTDEDDYFNDRLIPYLRSTLVEEGLVLQTTYDSTIDDAGDEPTGDAILYTEGLTLLRVDTGLETSGAGDIWYSNTYRAAPETFPSLNMYPISRSADVIRRFVKAGDHIVGLAPGRIYRFTRTGASVVISQLASGVGIEARHNADVFQTSIGIISRNGLRILDPSSGDLMVVGAVHRLVKEWSTSIENVHVGFDTALGAFVVLNTAQEDAFVLWPDTSSVTRLKDMRFSALTVGPNPGAGTPDQIFLVTPGGLLLTTIQDTSNAMAIMQYHSGSGMTFSGTITGVVGSLLEDTNAVIPSDMEDCYLYITSGTYTGNRYRITGTDPSAHRYYLDPAPPADVVGATYSIAPVKFQWTGWPLGAMQQGSDSIAELFHRKNVRTIGVAIGDLSAGTHYLHLGLRESPDDDFLVSESLVATTEPDDCFVYVNAARPLLFPSLVSYESNVEFSVRAVTVDGDYELSRESGS